MPEEEGRFPSAPTTYGPPEAKAGRHHRRAPGPQSTAEVTVRRIEWDSTPDSTEALLLLSAGSALPPHATSDTKRRRREKLCLDPGPRTHLTESSSATQNRHAVWRGPGTAPGEQLSQANSAVPTPRQTNRKLLTCWPRCHPAQAARS